LATGGIGGHQDDAIGTGSQIFGHNDHADGDDGTSLLEEIIGGNCAGEKDFLIGRTFLDFVAESDAGGLFGVDHGVVNFGIQDDVVGFLEAIDRERNDLHALDDEGSAVLEQDGIEIAALGDVVDALRIVGHGDAAESELLAVIRIDLERPDGFAVTFTASAEDDGHFVLAGNGIELIFVVEGILGEVFPLIFFEVELDLVAELGGDGTIIAISDTEDAQVGVVFALVLIELEHVGRNVHGEIDASDAGRGIEVRRLESGLNTTAASFLGVQFELFFDGSAVEDAGTAGIAVAAAGANIRAAFVHFYFESVATALGGFRRNVTEQIKFILFAGNFLEAAEQVVGIEDGEAASAFGEGSENLLIGGKGFGKLRDDGAGLI